MTQTLTLTLTLTRTLTLTLTLTPTLALALALTLTRYAAALERVIGEKLQLYGRLQRKLGGLKVSGELDQLLGCMCIAPASSANTLRASSRTYPPHHPSVTPHSTLSPGLYPPTPLPRCSSRRRRPPVRSSSRCPPTSGSLALGEAARGRTAFWRQRPTAGATPAGS